MMNTHADKAHKNKSQTLASAQKLRVGEPTFQLADHRPEAIQMRKIQEMANDSPKVKQLSAFQEMANHSPQVRQAAQLQAMAYHHSANPIQKKENNTGLPDDLKSGIESLSGYSMDDVSVHYHSDKPAQLQAHAYAQGANIHIASGQEKHLPHEVWHVVQQKQGRVKPTLQMNGRININDDSGLEKEADIMGAQAIQRKAFGNDHRVIHQSPSSLPVYQLKGSDAFRYVQSNELAAEAFFWTAGGKKRHDMTRKEVLQILNDHSISLENREGLRDAWNDGLSGKHRIEVGDTNYQPLLEAAQKEHMDKYHAASELDKVNEYDSGEEDNSIGVVGKIQAMFKETKAATVVTKEGYESTAYIFPPAAGVQVLQKIRKFRLFKKFPGIHIIFQVGEFWQLYTAPRENDFAYAPILEIGPGRFMREGSIDSWHAIAVALTDELKKFKDNSFKEQIKRIIDTFNGGKGPMTAGESHAVGAILCDYAAGVRGTLHYLEILAQAVNMGQVTDHMTAWTSDRPGYAPATIGGRPLVGADTLRGPPRNAMEEEMAPVDQAVVNGRRYTVNVAGVRSTGECFWDTLRHYGIDNVAMATAAATAGLTVDQHVNADSIGAFFTALSGITGETYRVNLDMINLFNLQPLGGHVIGVGAIAINIGFFIDPRTHLGHYVPNV